LSIIGIEAELGAHRWGQIYAKKREDSEESKKASSGGEKRQIQRHQVGGLMPVSSGDSETRFTSALQKRGIETELQMSNRESLYSECQEKKETRTSNTLYSALELQPGNRAGPQKKKKRISGKGKGG